MAISTAVSTDIPISASFIAVASFIPSPINPTVWPFLFKICTILVFCKGDNLAKISTLSTVIASSSSLILSISEPSKISLLLRPTFPHILFVTLSLSPVRTLVLTPYSFKAEIAFAVVGLGGSRKAKYPISTISISSLTPKLSTGEGFVFWARAITRSPSLFNLSTVFNISSFIFSDNNTILSWYSVYLQIESISSTAPFVIICLLPTWSSTTTVIRRREKSKGISSTFIYILSKSMSELSFFPSSYVFSIIDISKRFFNPVWK